jgi:hypothetical protein
MPKDFKGHLEPADPRGPVWGAGGCTWPTIPPYRFRLGCQNAPPVWEPLKSTGILFQASGPQYHDDLIYQAASAIPIMLQNIWIWRHYERVDQSIRWTFFFNNPLVSAAWEITDLQMAPYRCNVDIEVADYEWIYFFPSPGSPLVLSQVYFDENFPPGGWPPWT